MLYSIKDREDLENLNKLVSLKTQVNAVGSQNKPGKQMCQEDMKKYLNQLLKSL